MDILFTILVCLVCKLVLISAKTPRRPKKKREPIGAFIFGDWYYWYQAYYHPTKEENQ